MKRHTIALMFGAMTLGCGPRPPCEEGKVSPTGGVRQTYCYCAPERKLNPDDICCQLDGGVCEDQVYIPPGRASNPPLDPKFGLWDFSVHPGELVDTNNGTIVVPSAQNSVMPYVCQPMFAKWAYTNLTNGQLADSASLNLNPVFRFLGPSDGIEPELKLEKPVPFERIPYRGFEEMEVPISGQGVEAFYYAEVLGLPPETPGDWYLSVRVDGTSDTWDEWAWDFCELGFP